MCRNQLVTVDQIAQVNATVMVSRGFFIHGNAVRDPKYLRVWSEWIKAPYDTEDELNDFAFRMHDVSPKRKHGDVTKARLPEQLNLHLSRQPSLHDTITKLNDGVVSLAAENP